MYHWRYGIFILWLATSPVWGKPMADNPLEQAQTYLQQGQYYLAQDTLKAAQKTSEKPEQKIQIQGLLGLTHYRMHHYPEAEALLQEVINTSTSTTPNRAQWQLTLAAIRINQDQPAQAQALYAEALKQTRSKPELSLKINLGQAQLLPPAQRLTALQQISTSIQTLSPPAARIPLLINIAAQVRALKKASLQSEEATAALKPLTSTATQLIYESLIQAKNLSSPQQPRLQAEILDGLAQVYEDQDRLSEAAYFNRQALQAAKTVHADDLLVDLEWRAGRLYRAHKQLVEARLAYERAVAHIESIRQDIPVEYSTGNSSFRETLGPVYLGLADLLLTEANTQTGEAKTQLLRRTRDTVELIKQSELADFLGGRCAVANASNARLDTVGSGTAILYPIILPDRLEILVSYGEELQHFAQPVTSDDLYGATLSMVHSLRYKTDKEKTASKQLYDLLIAPLQGSLQQHHIHTLVWVPDGRLRLISPAALYDGEHYLIERYALATSPGLSLLDALPLQESNAKALLAGISEPGPVLDVLPAWVNNVDAHNVRSHDEIPAQQRAFPVAQRDLNRVAESNALMQAAPQRSVTERQALKEKLTLPGVKQEVTNLQQDLPNTTLMNETFTVDNFQDQLLRQPFSMVHIASHGFFGNSADNSFLMAYDNLISMNQLEQLLKADKFDKQPVQLITLSACQSAEGNDRAPLGLSGIAIKSRVRSALGTLWSVDDAAAAQLMTAFYRNLSKTDTNKAQALQQAQLALLKEKKFSHPYYWSPFILVGNWL